jgi:predicted kinase
MKAVYIVRGAPATGKGTVIPKFCELLPKPVALISQDVLRWDFHLVGRKVSDVTAEEHAFANKNTEMLFEQYLKNGNYTIVIEGLYTWDDETSPQGSASKLAELAKSYGFAVKNIVLKASKEELLARNAARHYTVPLDEFTMLYDGVYGAVGPSEVVIDSTGQTPEQTVESLKAVL